MAEDNEWTREDELRDVLNESTCDMITRILELVPPATLMAKMFEENWKPGDIDDPPTMYDMVWQYIWEKAGDPSIEAIIGRRLT